MHINRQEILDILTQDAYYRKIESWPLLTSESFLNYKNRLKESDDMFMNTYNSYDAKTGFKESSLSKINERMEKRFPFITDLLNEFNGHLVACGGAIVKQIISYQIFNNKEDIDLFFYDLTIEEANLLRIKIIEFLVNKWIDNNVKFNIQRNEFTTTIYVYDPSINHYGKSYKAYDTYVYQLIHRIYPTIDSIIGVRV